MLKPLSEGSQLGVVVNIIDYLRSGGDDSQSFLQIEALLLNPSLEADLACVGLSGYQLSDGCLITWSKYLDAAKNQYLAANEYRQLRREGPKGCEESAEAEDY